MSIKSESRKSLLLDTNDRSILNVRMLKKLAFKLRWGNLVALDFDEFLQFCMLVVRAFNMGYWDLSRTFFRSTIRYLPSSSTYAISPVLTQPSRVIVARVASGFFQ